MKKKITRIWSIGLVLVLAASLLLSAAPVSAKELAWGTEGTPGTTGLKILSETAISQGDVDDFAIGPDGTTLWATSAENNKLYKSTDGGWTWSSKTLPTGLTTPSGVAIAPDDADLVAVWGDTTEVYVTTNGGSSWGSLGTVQETGGAAATGLRDIAISAEDSGKHYVAVAGIEAGPLGNIWYFNIGAAAPAWTEINDKTGWGFAATTDVRAIEFSPNFASDFILLALSIDPGTPQVSLEMYSFNQSMWNASAGFTSYPVQIYTNAALSALSAADIALSPDYLGSDDAMRIAFGAIDVDVAAGDGIYRMKDTSVKAIKTGSGNDAGSVSYDGTNLVAGQAGGGNAIWRSDDPLASSPTFSTTSSLKRPGGATNVVVAWNGADVLAGTKGNDSCFAISRDNGKSFNGISLVDHPIGLGAIEDIAVSPDGSKLYLVSNDATDLRVWRKASTWESVMAVAGTTGYIVRIAPEDADTVYVAKTAGTTLYYSSEAGDTKWFQRACRYSMQDLTLESSDVLYAAVSADSKVSKSTNSGFTWASSKSANFAGAGNINSIRSLGEDLLIAGSAAGYVSYSTDGNSSWSKISKQLGNAAATVVTASGLADGDFIYTATAANTTLVSRWELGSSTAWKDMAAGVPATEQASGIELVNDTLYVATNDPGNYSTIYRSINPTGDTPAWQTTDSSAAGGEIFGGTSSPDSLITTEGSVKLWLVDTSPAAGTADDEVWTYTDTISATADGPTLAGPADGAEIRVNPVSGATYTVSLSWSRLSKATKYDVDIALDSGFNEKLGVSTTGTPTAGTSASTVSLVVAGSNFMPETTYYWRVRVNSASPLRSAWSSTRSFTITALPEAEPPVVVQAPPPAPIIEVPEAPAITLQPPEIVLPAPPPAPPEIVIPAAPPPAAPAIPAWAIYAIIIIGAVLVIALIVLIMRTRRAV
jgi:hypothetical protein